MSLTGGMRKFLLQWQLFVGARGPADPRTPPLRPHPASRGTHWFLEDTSEDHDKMAAAMRSEAPPNVAEKLKVHQLA